MNTLKRINRRGFTLIELLIVLGMLGVVMVAVYSLYQTHQQAAFTQDSVIEVQQNIRIGMSRIAKDIRMGGFLVPDNNSTATTPATINYFAVSNATANTGPQLFPAGNSDSITLTLASPTGLSATIIHDETGVGTAFPIDDPDGTICNRFQDLLNSNPSITAMVIRPFTKKQIGQTFQATAVNTAPPSIQLSGTSADLFKVGDMIVVNSGTFPSMITYCLGPAAGCGPNVNCPANQLCLMRIENNIAEVVAQNMAGMKFMYLEDGTFVEVAQPADYKAVRAIRIALTGQAIDPASTNIKRRQIVSVIETRNRKENINNPGGL